jgi:hypothetical protein
MQETVRQTNERANKQHEARQLEAAFTTASKALKDFEAGFPGHKHNPALKTVRGAANKLQQRALQEGVTQAACNIATFGHCPDCGRKLRRNLALTGWYQCEQFGAEQFRAEPKLASCNYQIIIPRS